jgi:hypothetical protein
MSITSIHDMLSRGHSLPLLHALASKQLLRVLSCRLSSHALLAAAGGIDGHHGVIKMLPSMGYFQLCTVNAAYIGAPDAKVNQYNTHEDGDQSKHALHWAMWWHHTGMCSTSKSALPVSEACS